MASYRLRPENVEERLIFWSLQLTWAFWALGASYVVFSLLGWVLAGLALARRFGWAATPHNHVERPAPVIVSAWLAGMSVMLVALIVGHIDFSYDAAQTIKSTLGWIKGWGLIGAFIFAGAMTQVRPQLIFRAMNMLAAQTLVITPVLIACAMLQLPAQLYVSPLHALIGSGEIFFTVALYLQDTGAVGFRLAYFAPWAPAAAFFAVVAFAMALFDKSPLWRLIGITAALTMCVLTASRLALIAVPLILLCLWVIGHITRIWMLALIAAVVIAGLLFFDPIAEALQTAAGTFADARADSSRVRATLQRIGLHRWEAEAFWFGHAIVEPGPHLVEYMMIGSHHTWIGLLFVKGLVGLLACLLPFAWTLLELVARSLRDRVARAGLGAMLALLLFSFGENVEMLVYLIWPAFLLVGVVAKRQISFPPEKRTAPQRFKELIAAAVVEVAPARS